MGSEGKRKLNGLGETRQVVDGYSEVLLKINLVILDQDTLPATLNTLT